MEHNLRIPIKQQINGSASVQPAPAEAAILLELERHIARVKREMQSVVNGEYFLGQLLARSLSEKQHQPLGHG